MLNDFGLKYRFNDERGECNKANIKKLLALAFFKNNSNFSKVETLLNSAKNAFMKLQVKHGVATCALALAQFMFWKPVEFTDNHRSETKIIDESLKSCENARLNYSEIKHNMGEAICL